MKNLTRFFILVTAVLAGFAQTLVSQTTIRDDFKNMTFEAKLNKNSYVMSEPIFINFKYSNQTGYPQTTYPPSFLQDSILKVTFGGKTSIIDHISSKIGTGTRFPGTVPPNWFSSNGEMLSSSFVSSFFPVSGNYQLQFLLHSFGGDEIIESNIITITIEKPIGIDKEAFDFMKKHKEFFGLSSWTNDEGKSEVLLEEFVNKYDGSVYGASVISYLANVYLAKGDFDKAKAEFDKIKYSENPLIATEAVKSLADIAKRKAYLNKSKQTPQ